MCIRDRNAELVTSGNFSGSDRMQSALTAALRLASMLSSNQSEDTIQQAMAVLDSVNKKLYGMIDQSSAADSTNSDQQRSGEVQSTTSSLDRVRGYGDDDDEDQTPGYGMASEFGRQKRPSSPTRPSGMSASSQQRSATGPSKRFHFGL